MAKEKEEKKTTPKKTRANSKSTAKKTEDKPAAKEQPAVPWSNDIESSVAFSDFEIPLITKPTRPAKPMPSRIDKPAAKPRFAEKKSDVEAPKPRIQRASEQPNVQENKPGASSDTRGEDGSVQETMDGMPRKIIKTENGDRGSRNGVRPVIKSSQSSMPIQRKDKMDDRYREGNGKKPLRKPVIEPREDDLEAKYDEIKAKQENEKEELRKLKVDELRKMATDEGVNGISGLAKEDIITKLMSLRAKKEGLEPVEGVLEILNDNYGFLRSIENNFLSGTNDVYVSPSQIRRFGLQTGLYLKGFARKPKGEEKYWAMLRIEEINDGLPEDYLKLTQFDNLIPYFPTDRFILETEPNIFETRIIDLISPIGKGQRGLIVSPPKAGKTIILQKIANAITTNNPECKLIVLLIDERPEEVTDMKRSVKAEVVSSTFDEPTSKHTKVADMTIERAKRLVEYGHDVVILLDSITRLGRAYNAEAPKSNKILTGGVDSQALQKPKKFFGAARNIEGDGHGSLTIIATALIETGSKMDEVIFEEFKGTGNMELVLDRRLADKRIYPAIDIKRSSTRKEELLMSPEEYKAVVDIRRQVYDMDDIESVPLMKDKMAKYEKNVLFLLKGGLFKA